MSLMRIAYIIGFLGLALLLLLQFAPLPTPDSSQASGVSSEPDKTLTLDQASSTTDVFYKLAPPARGTSIEGGRSGSIVNKPH